MRKWESWKLYFVEASEASFYALLYIEAVVASLTISHIQYCTIFLLQIGCKMLIPRLTMSNRPTHPTYSYHKVNFNCSYEFYETATDHSIKNLKLERLFQSSLTFPIIDIPWQIMHLKYRNVSYFHMCWRRIIDMHVESSVTIKRVHFF